MGNCASIKVAERVNGLPGPEALEYVHSTHLLIKLRDQSLKVVFKEKVIFSMTEPILGLSKQVGLGRTPVWTSASVLPGLDPRGMVAKHCQDMCFCESQDGSILLGLYDGHGKDGQAVVTFCKNFALSFFKKNQTLWQRDPNRFLMVLTHDCDRALTRMESGIDASYSGATQVLVLIHDESIHTACVGDSRAVLGTSSPPTVVLAEQPPRGEGREVLERVKRRRSVSIDRQMIAVQLTKDQKPEDPDEMERIQRMGGVVRRLMDETGRSIGPWRVWRKDANYPGLAMARSLGDISGSEIGVISAPMITTHVLRPPDDFFLVVASDGIW